jgi:hypothetical protein
MKNFLSGLEELIARIVSLIFSLLFFVVLISQKLPTSNNDQSWQKIFFILFSFWFAYEAIAYVLFILFKFFANRQTNSNSTEIQLDEADKNPPSINL